MYYLLVNGNVYTSLASVHNGGYRPGETIPFKALSTREYKRALRLNKTDPSNKHSLKSIVDRLNNLY